MKKHLSSCIVICMFISKIAFSEPGLGLYIMDKVWMGLPNDICIEDDLVFVLGNEYLTIFDVSDGEVDSPIGHLRLDSSYGGVLVQSGLAYIADGEGHLLVVDVSDPSYPSLLSSWDTSGQARDIAVSPSGSFLYIAEGTGGLQIVDISDPYTPVKRGLATGIHAFHVAAGGDHVYVTSTENGFVSVNVIDPDSPVIRDIFNVGDYAENLAISGQYAYVAWHNKDLYILDISNPASIQEVRNCPIYGAPYDIAISGDTAIVAAYWCISTVDISNPQTATESAYVGSTYAAGVEIVGNKAFVMDYSGGLVAIDFSIPETPYLSSEYWTPGDSWGAIDIAEGFGYIADINGRLKIIDTENPLSPVVSQMNTGFPFSVAIHGNLLLYTQIAPGPSSFYVADITDPFEPVQLGSVSVSEFCHMDASGQYAYIVGQDRHLVVVDFSTPSSPNVIAEVPTHDQGHDVLVDGTVVFVADGGYLTVFDVSNPATPTEIGMWGEIKVISLVKKDNYLYGTGGDNKLRVIDVSDATNPLIIHTSDISDPGQQMDLQNNLLYVPTCRNVVVYDVSNPVSPQVLAESEEIGHPTGLAVWGEQVYVTGYGGLTVLQLTEAMCPFNLIGDLNNDCIVDLQDLAMFSSAWLINCWANPSDPACIPK